MREREREREREGGGDGGKEGEVRREKERKKGIECMHVCKCIEERGRHSKSDVRAI